MTNKQYRLYNSNKETYELFTLPKYAEMSTNKVDKNNNLIFENDRVEVSYLGFGDMPITTKAVVIHHRGTFSLLTEGTEIKLNLWAIPSEQLTLIRN